MKHFLLAILFALTMSQLSAQTLKVMSYNLRMDTPNDKENAWPHRKDGLALQVLFHQVDILGVQEAFEHQLNDLKQRMPGFAHTGVGRDDGKKAGEYSAILFNASRFTLLDSGTFWLSPTPEKVSKGWDAAIVRVCSWAKFKDKQSKKTFYFFNTHFDHIGEVARTESGKLIVQKIAEITGNKFPVVLTGDFNSTPETGAYQSITAAMGDTYKLTKIPPFGPIGTFNGFDYNAKLENRIDYVFVKGIDQVIRYGVLTDALKQHFYSDHLPVLVELAW
jgi:endonuclease/exonuclease/phosphatase family metal-dependent hydrolase